MALNILYFIVYIMALNTLSSEDARHKRGHHKGQAAAWGNLVQVILRKHKRQKQNTRAARIGNRQSQLLCKPDKMLEKKIIVEVTRS